MKLQDDLSRLTLTRTADDKWSVHVDGVREKGVNMSEALQKVEDLLNNKDALVRIQLDTIKVE